MLISLASFAHARSADALTTPVATIDGPSADVVDLGSTAMADDGTGGIVYRKRVAGRTHIFAAQFVNGMWGSPRQVDTGQAFDSAWPVIGAGEGGRLVVAWTNNYSSTTDGLYSATLDPGALGFQPPIPIDLGIGQATATYPSLAMSRGGNALLSYRVVTAVGSAATPNLPPGYVASDIRLARYDGEFWSSFGVPLERNPAQPVRAPSGLNSPRVAIDLTGEGLLVFQEPDDAFVDRIYARRIFGMVPGNVLQVSPATYANKPLNAPADDFAIDVGGFGEAAVAFRQQPGAGSAFSRPRVFVNQLPNSFDPRAADFLGAIAADGAGGDGPVGAIGTVSVAVDGNGRFDLGFGVDAHAIDTRGSERAVSAVTQLDDGTSDAPGNPAVTRAEDGALAAAWQADVGGSGSVAVLERRADGTPLRELVSAGAGGAVHSVVLGGSHRGDAVIGFLQGDGASAQIAALAVRAPPGAFTVATPATYVGGKQIPLMWDTPQAGAGAITYAVLVDDQQVAGNLSATQYLLSPAQASDGTHDVRIEATDAQGQVIDSAPSTLKVDRAPPTVRVRKRGAVVHVQVSDSQSGVDAHSVKVRFGDGRQISGHSKTAHRYAHAGNFTITVSAADAVGNRRTLRKRVRA